MVSAWQEPPDAMSAEKPAGTAEHPAGVRDGLEALAFSTTETPPRNNLPEKCETGQSNNKVGRSPRSPLRAKLYLPPGAYQLTYT